MDKKLIINYVYNILYQVVTILAPLITIPYTTRILGEVGLGVNTFTSSVVQWFVIFGIMGINNYGIKTIGTKRDNRQELSKTFCGIFLMQLTNLLIAFVAYVIFVLVSKETYQPIYLVQSLTIIATALDISWFYLGIEDFKTASIRNILVKIIGIAFIFLFVKKEEDLLIFVIINNLMSLFGQAIMLVQLPKYIDFSFVGIKESYQEHFKNNVILFIPQLATSVYNILDSTLVGILATDWEAQSAFYAQATRFVKMFLYFITSIGAVMMPRIANTFSKGDEKQVSSYLTTSFNLAMYLAIPIMLGTASVSPYLIPWFMDESFNIVGKLIVIVSPIILLISLSNVFGIQYLLPTGKMKQYSASVVIGAVVNLVCNILLIPRYGALGACFAIVAAEASVTCSQLIFIKGQLKLDIKKRSLFIYFISGFIMYMVVIVVGQYFGPSLTTNIIQVITGALCYLGLLTILKEEFHFSIIQKIMEMVKRK